MRFEHSKVEILLACRTNPGVAYQGVYQVTCRMATYVHTQWNTLYPHIPFAAQAANIIYNDIFAAPAIAPPTVAAAAAATAVPAAAAAAATTVPAAAAASASAGSGATASASAASASAAAAESDEEPDPEPL